MEEVKRSSQEQNLEEGIILESVRKMRENKELVDLAADLQVRGLTEIVPADIISNSVSCSVFVDINMANISGEVLPQKKVKELIEGDKDVNHNGGVEMSYKEDNIYAMETAIVVNTIDENVEGQEDENDNSTNVIIEVADILENANDHHDDPINNAEGDREDDHLDLEDNERSDKAKFELQMVTGSIKRDDTSEQHRLISSKMAKVGLKEFRCYLCRDCEITGAKDFIYDHIAEEHVHVEVHNEKEGHMNDMIDCNSDSGSDKIIPKVNPVPSVTELQAVPSSTDLQAVPSSTELQAVASSTELQAVPSSTDLQAVPSSTELQAVPSSTELQAAPSSTDLQAVPSSTESQAVTSSTELQVSFTKVRKLESSEAKRNGSNQIIARPKKRKVVTFSPNDPEVFLYEREDKTYFKKRRPSGAEREDTEGGRVNTQSEDTVNAHKENKENAGMDSKLRLLAGGILSITQQGFRVQDKPRQIKDL